MAYSSNNSPYTSKKNHDKHPVSQNPFAVSDNGPIHCYQYVRAIARTRRLPDPFEYNGHTLPGSLSTRHLPQIDEVLNSHPEVTHFSLSEYSADISFHAFVRRKGWSTMNYATRHIAFASEVNAGLTCIFSLQHAAGYLREHGNKHNPPVVDVDEFDEEAPYF
ncbi:hypothetical protein K5D56_26105 [Pseudomonas cichorii]|nr:hypothetical protein [Pseudomonas cichorii]MBX8557033.1 hypothetical protein [Pseudomonas cichorii]MBX8592852.1 hypothetical protein [Pseudomonas cichorii]